MIFTYTNSIANLSTKYSVQYLKQKNTKRVYKLPFLLKLLNILNIVGFDNASK